MLPVIYHRYLFLFGLIALVSGALFGAVPTSIPQIILAANWLLETNFVFKWNKIKNNKIFWLLILFYVLHVVGMFYTSNINDGLNDLRVKMPLIVLPIILFTTQPLNKKEFDWLFKFFFLSVVVSSICCFVVYLGYTKKIIVDVRQASIFMSHIRFSLFIAFAIMSMCYYLATSKNRLYKLSLVIAIIWLVFFMYKLQMATGFLILVMVALILGFVFLFKSTSKKIIYIIFIGIGLGFLISQFRDVLTMYEADNTSKTNKPLFTTPNGNPYYSNTASTLAENGTLIDINVCNVELEKEWHKRSSIFIYQQDKKGNMIFYTLLRYMASKGLTKDSAGIAALTNDDLKNIEFGCNNYKYTYQSGMLNKLRDVVYEYKSYQNGGNPSGHTLTMRLEFWKTALYIIKQNVVFGVGTGDAQDSFNKTYRETNSKLSVDWHKRSHNQYLAILVAFGVVGFIYFLVYLFYPVIALRKNLHVLFWPFFLIAILSFITEDTLETQAGVTFFALYYFMFLWLAQTNKTIYETKN